MDAANAGQGLGGTIMQLLLALPKAQAEQRMQEQQLALQKQHLGLQERIAGDQAKQMEAHSNYYNAEGGLAKAKTDQIVGKMNETKALGDALAKNGLGMGGVDPEVLRALAPAVMDNPLHGAQAISHFAGLGHSNINDPNVALQFAGGNPQHNVVVGGNNTTLWTPQGGVLGTAARDVAPGHTALPPVGGLGQTINPQASFQTGVGFFPQGYTAPPAEKPFSLGDVLTPGEASAAAKLRVGTAQDADPNPVGADKAMEDTVRAKVLLYNKMQQAQGKTNRMVWPDANEGKILTKRNRTTGEIKRFRYQGGELVPID
jgi:hypothetical protein